MNHWRPQTLFIPPVFHGDAAKTLRAKLLHYALLANMALMAACVVAGLVGSGVPALVIKFEVGFAAAFFLLRRWLYQGRIRLVSGVFLAAGFSLITVAIASLGTIRVPATGFYLALIIAAGIFFDLAGLSIMIGLSSLAVAALILAENAGLLPHPQYAVTITQWLVTSALFACLGFWTAAVLSSIRNALREAEQEGIKTKRNETRLRLALEAAHQSWFELDLRTGAVVTSEEYARLIGYDPATFASTLGNWLENIHPEDRAAVQETFRRCVANGQTLSAEYRRRTADGGWRWIHSVGRVVEHDSAGHPRLLSGTHSDITARKQAEESRREIEERFVTLFNNLNMGVLLQGPQAEILLANPRAMELLGLTKDQLLGRSSFDPEWNVIHEDGSPFPGSAHPVPQAIATRQPVRQVIMGVQRPRVKDRVWLSVNADPQLTDTGAVRQVICTFEDTTARRHAEIALRDSEGQLRIFIDCSPVSLAMFDREMRYLQVSRRWMLDYNLGARDVRGLSHYAVFPEIEERWKEVHRRGLAGEVVRAEDDRFVRIDGSEQWLRWEVRPWRDAAGGIGGILIFSEDITSRKQMAEALRTSEAQLATAMDQAHLAHWALDIATGMFTFNDRFYALCGTTAKREGGYQMSSGDYAREFLLPDDQHVVPDSIAELAAGARDELQLEHRIRRRDGELRDIIVRVTSVREAGGRVVGTRGTNQDITDLRRAEDRLQESESALSAAQRVAKVGSWVWHIQDNRLEWSDEMFRIFGLEREGFSGDLAEVVARAIHPDDRAAVSESNRRVVEHQAPEPQEYRIIVPDGTVRTVWGEAGRLVLDQQGRPAVLSGIVQDITVRKQVEEALQSSLHEKEALLMEVHHRVKNNLQVISSLLRLEAARQAQPETKTVLKEMQGRIRSMAVLHESLYRSGTLAAVDLGGYLRQLATQSFDALVTQPGAVQLRLDLASIAVEMDQALPCGLLINELLSNCLKHAFPNGRQGEVRVELRPEGGGHQLRLCVSDTGVGLPADFDAERVKSLGLKLVADLAGQLGGKLEIGPGSGAVFTVTFPAKEPRFRRTAGRKGQS